MAGHLEHLKAVVARLRSGGVPASAFIDAELHQVAAAAECGFEVCEIHTGPWAHAHAEADGRLDDPAVAGALAAVTEAGRAVQAAGMRFNAGHALNYTNVIPIAEIKGLDELHIGHSIVSRSIFTGFQAAVTEMHDLVRTAGAHPMAEHRDPQTVINAASSQQLPYRIAVLCYLEDTEGRLLMLHRSKNPQRRHALAHRWQVGSGHRGKPPRMRTTGNP